MAVALQSRAERSGGERAALLREDSIGLLSNDADS
eukprot:COSAG02_NODE_36338_length_456_cov_0.574230_2_plen_34_part_01